ncbi:sulfite exporter TauE/SafE family protein [Micrococcoides hystricis]|uniref:Probable membrane transporter protein n=1 Tax=Micrococcoides hystricis TaxID=1572761 RepID=A0ABV6PBA8_9MICC
MSLGLVVGLVALIVIGAAAQRISGLGFALMLAPFLAILLGPHEGVMITNLFGGVSPLLILLQVWDRVDWRRCWQLAIPAIPTSFLGIWATAILPTGPMGIVIGAFVALGLLTAIFMQARANSFDNTGLRTGTGLLTGFTNAVAGVGGPPLTAYALISRWDPVRFAATIQPVFVVICALTFITKLIATPEQMPTMPLGVWVACFAAMLVGIWAGSKLERRISPTAVRTFVIVIAFLGAGTALVKGILQVAGVWA